MNNNDVTMQQRDEKHQHENSEAKHLFIKKWNENVRLLDHKECGITLNANAVIHNTVQLLQLLKSHTSINATEKNLEARLSLWINTLIFRADESKRIDDTVSKLFPSDQLRTSQQLAEQHNALRAALETLKQAFEAKQLFRDVLGAQRRQRLECVQKNLDNLFVRKLNEIDLKSASKTQLSSRIQAICSLRPSIEAQQAAVEDAKAKYSGYANVLEAILDKIAKLGIVRVNGRAHEPIYTSTHQFTYAYRLWGNNDGELDDLVMFCLHPKEDNPELWGAVFDKPGLWRSIARDLEKTYDIRFPEKVPQQETRAFRNGIYNCETDRFFTWDSPMLKHLPDLCPCLYIDMDFENDEYEYIIHKYGWRALPVPEFDAIFDVQQWTQEERDWWIACMGRMLYPMGKHDRWERVVYHMGAAGSGKSTTIQFWMSYYPPEKVGVLNDNCEKVFGLEPLEKTWAWTALDVGRWEGMNQKNWNLMADGGNLPIARKRLKAAPPKPFKQPGMFASNQVLSWRDTNGEIVRRMLPFFYSKTPGKKGNANLVKEFRRVRLAVALKKMVCAYREKYTEHEILGPHNLPDILLRNLQVIQRHTNPLFSFLNDSVIKRNPKYYIEFELFKKSYQEFARCCNMRNRQLPADEALLKNTLDACECKLVYSEKDLPGPPTKVPVSKGTFWVVGCCVSELEFFQYHAPKGIAPPTKETAALYGVTLPPAHKQHEDNSEMKDDE